MPSSTPRRLTLVTLIAMITLLSASHAWSQDTPDRASRSARQIIDAMTERSDSLGVTSGQATVKLLIEDRTGDQRVRMMRTQSKDVDDTSRTLVKLTAPKGVAGQAFLFSANKGSEDDVWMYLPAFKVKRRIEGSQKRGAFLGSHFTFSDLESRDIKEANLERLKDAKVGKHPVYVISATPKSGAESDYGKVVVFVRQSDDMPLKIRFYERDKKTELKTIFVEKISKDDRGNPYTEQMTLHSKKGGFTTIQVSDIDTKSALPDTLFSKDQLGK